tara:strand:+ start:1066 stop:1926 length:861 start_codon:yes stop_codon:yes gene_type:complete
MAITETRNLPAPFIQSLGEYYGKELPALTKDKMDTSQWAPTVAGQDTLQTQAATLAGTQGKGIGAFEDYISGPTGAEAYSGPDAYKQFMSPYQQQVIDATMTSFDKQAAMQRRGISDKALQAGAFGGSRHAIAGSEYDAASDMNRNLMQSQLLQQGYGQGIAGANTAFNQQSQLAQTVPGMYQADIATLGTVGAQQQAQAQATGDAGREGKRMAAFEPYERLGFLGQGLTGIMGGYGNQYQFQQQPNPTPLQTALGAGATMAGIYGAVRGGDSRGVGNYMPGQRTG